MLKAILRRFIRAAISGAVATMVLISPVGTENWNDVGEWLNILAIGGTVGGFTGVIQAADKYLRWKTE